MFYAVEVDIHSFSVANIEACNTEADAIAAIRIMAAPELEQYGEEIAGGVELKKLDDGCYAVVDSEGFGVETGNFWQVKEFEAEKAVLPKRSVEYAAALMDFVAEYDSVGDFADRFIGGPDDFDTDEEYYEAQAAVLDPIFAAAQVLKG